MSLPDWWKQAEPDIHSAIGLFSEKVRSKVENQSAKKLITTKNPFLFRARAATDANLLANMVIDSFLSASEETMFGNVLEEVAIIVCSHAKGGRKSSTSNIDLEYDEAGQRTIVQVKSGPNWGNSSQRKQLENAFKSATRILRQGTDLHVRCVEGICYGSSGTKDLITHLQLIGNDFWYDISNWDGTAKGVLEIIGQHSANGLRETREKACEKLIHYMKDRGVVTPKGEVKWDMLLDLVMTKKK